MPIAFNLTIVPATRKLVAGSHPGRPFVALNGAETPILQGDRMTGARITASWPALPDDEAQKADDAWADSYSGALDVEVPPGLLEGVESDTGKTFPIYLSWTIAEPPVRDSLKPGYSSLSLVMRGRLLQPPMETQRDSHQVAIITGRNGAFSRGGVVIAHCRNWSLNIAKDVIETTALNVYDRTYVESLRGTTGSVVVLYNDTNPGVQALFNRILANDLVDDEFGFILNTVTNARIEAAAIINSMSIPMSVGEAMATTFSITVNGPLAGAF